ncbi:coiled-coil domain-containing protein 115-like [Uloborus diversus]|uniref:coiled-coil domain-containing protein 115-like n=1 Tax=Uloborus diversus TaxID=327109 RepID=UPI0024098226|nr:coiled-coil domain-containing protein 115-like [Uloborus diversus]
MKSIISERLDLDKHLQEGYIDMAKSRYLMRGQEISILQVNESNLLATRKVVSSVVKEEGREFISFTLSEVLPSDDNGNAENLRFRHSKKGKNENELTQDFKELSLSNEDVSSSLHESTNASVPNVVDPLHWFGILVPREFRNCKTKFQESIGTAIKIVTLQNELKALCSSYRSLRLQKKALHNGT